jgi:hypothetical protein
VIYAEVSIAFRRIEKLPAARFLHRRACGSRRIQASHKRSKTSGALFSDR